MFNINHSVYYYHFNHQENSYKVANLELDVKIEEIYHESKDRYGSPKITKILNNQGIKVSQNELPKELKS